MKKQQIIFVPGVMGSVLKEKNRKLWPDYSITSTKYEDLKNINNEHIYAEKLEPITYLPIIKLLKTYTPNFIPFAYDWRQNNLDHIDTLFNKLDDEADEIILVAHSMGGILSKLMMSKYNNDPKIKKIKKFITLGTPWKGSLDAYKTLKYGKKIPDGVGLALNKKTAKEISPYFPSLYQLLPNNDYLLGATDSNGKSICCFNINGKAYSDIDDLFINILQEQFQGNMHVFSSVFQDFRELLKQPLNSEIHHFEIVGVSKPTITSINEDVLNEATGEFYDGDGVVPTFSAASSPFKQYYINKVKHASLVKDADVLVLIRKILEDKVHEDTKKIFSDLKSKHYKKFSGKIVKVACPVEVSILDEEGTAIFGSLDTIDEEGIKNLFSDGHRYEEIGETTYIILDDEEEQNPAVQTIRIQATATGTTSVAVDEYKDGQNIKRNSFKTFVITPDIEAELTINTNLEKNTLILDNWNTGKEVLKSSTTKITENIKPPKTFLDIDSKNSYSPSEAKDLIVNSDIEISIKKIEVGTFDIDGTFVKVNDEIIILNQDGTTSVPLNEGYNQLEYFSKDILGTYETANTLVIYKISNELVKLDFEFLPHQYLINVKWNNIYDDILSKFDIVLPKLDWKISSEDKKLGNSVSYSGKVQSFNLVFQDIFKLNHEIKLTLDENIIQSIFEGTAEKGNLEELLKNFSLEEYKINFTINGNSRFTKLSHENINKFEVLRITNDSLSITIRKAHQYDLYWNNLSEELSLNKLTKVKMEFKLLDINKNEIKSVKLGCFVQISMENSTLEYTPETSINFDNQLGSYTFELDLTYIKKMCNDGDEFEIIIYEEESKNSIRHQKVLVRK
ncbi:lipase/acyltransferase domain-containing protein [Sporosarcina sp. FSL K6-5500]|uniref:lipase/acyltransferase domain-containing protein n=1 Tax=Sporosarcina sp. FSL K6-5500 TaxID=2921558 RepID=UPI0030F79C6F